MTKRQENDKAWSGIKGHLTGRGVKQKGFASTHGITKRSKRSFGQEREAQMLKHISTLLFFETELEKAKAVEVEMMYTANNNLFVAANNNAALEVIWNVLANKKRLKTVLTSKSFGGKRSTKGIITLRHQRKLKKRIFGSMQTRQSWMEEEEDEEDARQTSLKIGDIVRTTDPQDLSFDNTFDLHAAVNGYDGLYVLFGKLSEEGRHAEEKLMDLLQLTQYKQQVIVAGKMRPCGTCSGRMSFMNTAGYNVVYNPRAGAVWKDRFLKQSAAIQAHTIRIVRTGKTHETEINDSYNSESDSDDDE